MVDAFVWLCGFGFAIGLALCWGVIGILTACVIEFAEGGPYYPRGWRLFLHGPISWPCIAHLWSKEKSK